MLEIESLSKTFQMNVAGTISVTPVRNVSFSVKAGEFLGISGPSGIGKSSILKCIYRTYMPTAGRIMYTAENGRVIDIAKAEERLILRLRVREIGYVSQFLRVIPRTPAVEVVADRLLSIGRPRHEALQQAEDMLSRLRIPKPLWSAYPATFSGGEQQRVNLARAFIVRPRLLILDEPTASLDAETKRQVAALLQSMKRDGTTMIGVFHDTDMMEQVADRILDIRTLI